jgi:hypothetical protein
MIASGSSNSLHQASIAAITETAYRVISRRFPICAASDEFYFFPQVLDAQRHWSAWDDFSAASIEVAAGEIRRGEDALSVFEVEQLSSAEQIDVDLLRSTLCILREQLCDFAPHRTQPTFHLTIVAAGLAEALASDDPAAWPGRAAGLPQFLQRAAGCFDRVPRIFLEMGRDMVRDLLGWLGQLEGPGRETREIRQALVAFQAELKKISVGDDFRLPEEQFSDLIATHIGCGMSIGQVSEILDQEFREMTETLECEVSRLASGCDWTEAERSIPFCKAPGGNLLDLYRSELEKLEAHCRAQGFVPEAAPSEGTLQLAEVPASLAAIRASDAYSAIPGHPSRGGIFYVMPEGHGRAGQIGRSLEYRLTAVHEAWPGHHLLDFSRWSLERFLRRPIEKPLFYEGWACLAEELMARTGYLENPWDRFLLARRRLERAARGRIDLGLQGGRMELEEAAELLVSVGYRSETARSVVPKYLLRPGYQVCYTVGLQQALKLFETYGRNSFAPFVRKVLTQGEIGFERLATLFEEDL